MAASATDPDLLRARLERLRQQPDMPVEASQEPVEALSTPSAPMALPVVPEAPNSGLAASALEQGAPGLGDRVADFMGNVNVGLSRTLGMPSDMLNTLFGQDPSRSIIGSAGIQSGLERLNMAPAPGEEGDDFLSRTAQNIGAAALPFGGAAAAGSRIAAAGGQAVGPLAKSALTAFQRPLAAGAVELGGAAGAAGGGMLAERVAPEMPAARMVGELVGGMAGSGLTQAAPKVSPTAIAAKGVRALRRAAPFTGTGARARAADRLRSLVEDPAAAASRIEAGDTLPGVSPAQRSGEPGLVALEREVAKQKLDVGGTLDRAQAATTSQAREGLRFGGRAEDARRFLENVVEDAANKARRRLDRMRPGASIRDASQAARADIDAALGAARGVEGTLWDAVPQDAPVRLGRSQALLREELLGRTIADDPADLPRFVTGLLGNVDDNGNLIAGQLGDESHLKAVRTLRTRIGKAAAAERAKDAPNRNKIRILSSLESALLDDLTDSPGGPELEKAIAYSREMNQKFRQGIVGEILGFEQTGEGRIAPESTLERALGRQGEAQGVAARELKTAAPDTSGRMAEFVRNRFRDEAVDPESGRIKPDSAKAFLKQNRALLEEFPTLRDEITQAASAQRGVDTRLGRPTPGPMSATQRARTAVAAFIDAPVEKEIDRVLRSSRPDRSMKELMREVAADRSGGAMRGLKAAFGEHLMKESQVAGDLTDGTAALSGRAMRRMVDENRAVIDTLFTTDERTRLATIVRTLERQDIARGRLPDVGGDVIKDAPARIVDFIGRTLGARSGAKLGAGTSGASLLTAHFGAERVRTLLTDLTNDQARELLIGAVTDEKLMAALLRDQAKAAGTRKAADFRVIRAYLGVPASTAVRGGEEERKELPKNSTQAIRERLQRLRDPEEQGGDLPPSEPAAQREGAENDPHGIRQFLEALA